MLKLDFNKLQAILHMIQTEEITFYSRLSDIWKKFAIFSPKHSKPLIGLLILMSVLIFLFTTFIGPEFLPDTETYVESMAILSGKTPGPDFIPNRILTTVLGMETIMFFTNLGTKEIFIEWFLLNIFYYAATILLLYHLLNRIFKDRWASFLSSAFLAANYGFLILALHYMMDLSGWFFYLVSIYFLYRYSQRSRESDLYLAALVVGIGGLYKEYALLGAFGIGTYIILENWKNIGRLIRLAATTASITVLPIAILYGLIYKFFGYTYLDWISENGRYIYDYRSIAYLKAGGSLINVLALPFLGGLWLFIKNFKKFPVSTRIFLIAFLFSLIPVLVWPAIIQRVLTIVIPFVVTIAAYAFHTWNKLWQRICWIILLIIYTVLSFCMDAYILPGINLPFW